ncbi:MAG: hypothetical protein Q8861_02095 [Bacteroidota bacterium]|nr:hypothetical protein [Bacteroidota bacterium]
MGERIMKTPLDYFKEQEPEDWADADYYKVDSMLNLMERIQKDAYNEGIKDAHKDIKPAYFKLTFRFQKGDPRGGIPYWTTEIKIFEAKNEDELNNKISDYIRDTHCGYALYKKLISCESI